jgi:hypothetical protein
LSLAPVAATFPIEPGTGFICTWYAFLPPAHIRTGRLPARNFLPVYNPSLIRSSQIFLVCNIVVACMQRHAFLVKK